MKYIHPIIKTIQQHIKTVYQNKAILCDKDQHKHYICLTAIVKHQNKSKEIHILLKEDVIKYTIIVSSQDRKMVYTYSPVNRTISLSNPELLNKIIKDLE